MSSHAQRRGEQGENLACSFLQRKGYQLIVRNYRIAGGEIDLVMRDGSSLVFVEVKARTGSRYGYPEESVTRSKINRMSKTARQFLCRYPMNTSYRFDIIAIERIDAAEPTISHIENILDVSLY
ncbi:YraN family protein [Candidatus Uhrbacteria bacterium]|nr:YraN family protein [Candidatus Uhrbacteria bacterium]